MTQDARMLLEVEGLRVSFAGPHGAELRAVDDVSFGLAAGEALVVVGESGSGKTLTALSILGLAPTAARVGGTIRFEGTDLVSLSERRLREIRGRAISMIYQDPMSALDPVWSVGEQITETIRAHERVSRQAASTRAKELLGRVGLPEPERIVRAFPHELSGGMRQRALIAIALACQPRLLIADEPTTALDVTIQAQILELLKGLREELGLAILLITHDMGVAADIADRVLVMYAGRIAELGSALPVFEDPAHPYTGALLGSADLAAAVPKTPLVAIPGVPPSIAGRPPGCPFHPRCPNARPRCSTDRPDLAPKRTTVAACHFPLGEYQPTARESVA